MLQKLPTRLQSLGADRLQITPEFCPLGASLCTVTWRSTCTCATFCFLQVYVCFFCGEVDTAHATSHQGLTWDQTWSPTSWTKTISMNATGIKITLEGILEETSKTTSTQEDKAQIKTMLESNNALPFQHLLMIGAWGMIFEASRSNTKAYEVFARDHRTSQQRKDTKTPVLGWGAATAQNLSSQAKHDQLPTSRRASAQSAVAGGADRPERDLPHKGRQICCTDEEEDERQKRIRISRAVSDMYSGSYC